MIVSSLKQTLRLERAFLALEETDVKNLCNELYPFLGRVRWADSYHPDEDYRVLKWSGSTNVQNKHIVDVVKNYPLGLFVLKDNDLRVVVSRRVKPGTWNVNKKPYDKAKALATRARNKIRNERKDSSQPNMDIDHLGWRVWGWNGYMLFSPSFKTIWPEDGILETMFDENDAVRGLTGIHAARIPINWEKADIYWNKELAAYDSRSPSQFSIIDGIIERYGRAVVGDYGFRCERAVIRRIRAATTEVGLAIEQRYPSIEVYYDVVEFS